MILFLTGCAGLFVSQKPDSRKSPEQLLDELKAQADKLQSFQGQADILVSSSYGIFQGALTIKIKTPDTLWIKAEGMLGVDMGVMRMAGDTFVMYSPWEHVLYTGTKAGMMSQSLLPFDLPDLLKGVSGLLSPDPSFKDSIPAFSAAESHYEMVFSTGDRILISPKGPTVIKWEKIDASGESEWIWEAKDLRKYGPVYLPEKVRVSRPKDSQKISMAYYKMQSNGKLKTGWAMVPMPEGATRLELDNIR